MAASSVSESMIDRLRLVFTPMEEKFRNDLLDQIRQEMDRFPIIAFASDVPRNVHEEVDVPIVDANGNPVQRVDANGKPVYECDAAGAVVVDDDGHPKPLYKTWKKWIPVERVNIWALGEPSPSDPDCVIFAMTLHENIPAIIVWSVKQTPREGGTTIEYFHERIRNFHIAQGPCSAKALYLDMVASLSSDEDPPEPEAPHTNGTTARA